MKFSGISATAAVLAAVATLSGCSWLSTSESDDEQPRVPPCGIEYRCVPGNNEAGRSLYLRAIERKSSLWVVLPEREFRVDPASPGSTSRYSNGRSTLDLAGDVATLTEEGTVTYANCKRVGAKPLPLCKVERQPDVFSGPGSP